MTIPAATRDALADVLDAARNVIDDVDPATIGNDLAAALAALDADR